MATFEPWAVGDTPSLALYPGERALQSLISGTIPQGERTSLIEKILSSRGAAHMIGYLQESDAQTFIDIVDEALENLNLTPQFRRKCLKLLYRACTGHSLLPRSLQIQLHDNPTGVALYRGGFGDVWKREYRGQEVAVKVVRTYANSDLQKITRCFCKEFVTWKALRHPNVLPLLGVIMTGTQFAMVSEWMPNGNVSQFVMAHRDANRFELLADVARGLIYMHGQGMVHGDIKGANILIDETAHARLADFGLLALISDATSRASSSSIIQGGTYRWMSPELFYPEKFGLKNSSPTKHSDCYALGMVIYEVLSGRVPFSRHNMCAVVSKVSRGERPGRPRGVEGKWFTDGIWRILERCWTPQPNHRPRIEDILQYLEETSRCWTPVPPRVVADPPTTNPSPRSSSDPNTEGSTEDSEASSLSPVITSEISSFARPFGESAEHDVEESVVGTRDELADGPFDRVDSPSDSSSSDGDDSILCARPMSTASDSNADPSPVVDGTTNPNIGDFTSAPTLDFTGQEQRTSPANERSSWVLSWTPAEPPSSSHGYDTDSSSSGIVPVVPPKPTNIPSFAISKQRGRRRSPRIGLPRGYTQPTSPRQSDPSLQTPPAKSLSFFSTVVEPPSSSYGYETPPQTTPAKSLALLSTLVEPPSSIHEHDTPSSSTAPFFTPPRPTNIPGPAASRQRGRKSRHSRLPREDAQPTRQSTLPQRPPAKVALFSAAVVPPSLHGSDTDSSSSTISLVLPPRPTNIPGPATSKQQGGMKSRGGGPRRNRAHSTDLWQNLASQFEDTPVFFPSPPSSEPQANNFVGVVPYGDTRGVSVSRTRRGRFGSRLPTRTWKNWLRSSLGKLFGNPVTSS